MDIIRKLKILRYRNNSYFKKFFRDVNEKDINKITFCSFDLETTGLDVEKDEIISIGAVKIKEMKIDLSTSFYRIVKPERIPEKENILIHSITASEMKKGEDIRDVLPKFLEYIKGTVLIGYFVSFDISMLSKYTQKFYGFPILNPYIDVSQLYIKKKVKSYTPYEKIKEKSLDQIAEELNIPVRKRHNALYDSITTALIFLSLMKR
ncbi:MAG TPA: 3'-5' exonuclease [Persephonella sp.]|uniref:DNA polymerase III subunit epsilon n=1 Tax=Persephonella marina (strain DSM 14350 / EX-H1) TaxID=123214 RepID=C0QPN1_PERMH|nr:MULTISPECIES: exonuclease domain-containing protein [Persephonella]ACO04671.1 DNA polymerase III subunit epsilon [Persephonella marina EX-H1]HCB69758.1 3'-5' exonuclease [Persephonella sp.]